MVKLLIFQGKTQNLREEGPPSFPGYGILRKLLADLTEVEAYFREDGSTGICLRGLRFHAGRWLTRGTLFLV